LTEGGTPVDGDFLVGIAAEPSNAAARPSALFADSAVTFTRQSSQSQLTLIFETPSKANKRAAQVICGGFC